MRFRAIEPLRKRLGMKMVKKLDLATEASRQAAHSMAEPREFLVVEVRRRNHGLSLVALQVS